MRIKAILRFRNEDLTRKRLIAGFKTQKELADYLNIVATTVSSWETFKTYPVKKKLIPKIEEALNCKIEEIFPPQITKSIRERIGRPIEKVFDARLLPSAMTGQYLLPDPSELYENKELKTELKNAINEALKTLTEREKKVLEMRFGLNNPNGNDYTLEETAYQFRVTKERIRQIEAKALRKLKHPTRSKRLRRWPNYSEEIS